MYTNKHLKEVLCTYKFIPGATKWDSAFFGQFYDKISDAGFTARQEKKGIVFEIAGNINGNTPPTPNIQEAESQMIFRDPVRNFAITMGNSLLSFHIVNTYETWEAFNEKLMKPFMEKYLELGIYEKIQSCQVVYLNRFEKPEAQDISDYFTVLSPSFKQFGKETNVQLSKSYITPNDVVLNFRITPQQASIPQTESLMLECGAVGHLAMGKDIREWKAISQDVKNPVKDFFESIITDTLRQLL